MFITTPMFILNYMFTSCPGALPVRRWRPVMQRPVMPTNIMSSPGTNIMSRNMKYSTSRDHGG